jgi:hypothetical protein
MAVSLRNARENANDCTETDQTYAQRCLRERADAGQRQQYDNDD